MWLEEMTSEHPCCAGAQLGNIKFRERSFPQFAAQQEVLLDGLPGRLMFVAAGGEKNILNFSVFRVTLSLPSFNSHPPKKMFPVLSCV